jgi:DNA-binding LacI/PurR family transcriptional regulator/DNA-binding transcriptional regulator YhcF (GntR family)
MAEPAQFGAVDRGIAFLRETLGGGTWKNGDRLPSLAVLAGQARVSRSSMWRALAQAKTERLVTITPRGFITAGVAALPQVRPDSPPTASAAGAIWMKKRKLLEEDILAGAFSENGQLPSRKELQVGYGISGGTLTKILASLTQSGIVGLQGRSYRIPLGGKSQRHSVALISEGLSWKAGLGSRQLERLVDATEQLCGRTGIDVEFLDLDFSDPDLVARFDSHLRGQKRATGYVVNVPPSQNQEAENRIESLLEKLSAHRKPIALLDMNGTYELAPRTRFVAPVQVFRIAGRSAGAQVARHVAGLGHRDIVFLSHAHADSWSVQRLAGAMDIFEAPGRNATLTPVTVDHLEFYDRSFMLGSIPAKDAARILAGPSSHDQLARFARHLDDGGWPKNWDHARIGRMRSELQTLHRLTDEGVDSKLLTVLRDSLLNEIAIGRNEELFEKLFDDALAHERTTAWIAVNDGLAANALRFLERRKIQVPQDLSIVGFDNVAESFGDNLTTYDFGLAQMAHRMLWFVMHPDLRRGHRVPPPLEVEGIVVARKTTGVPKRPPAM